eukprot:92647_1
MNKVKNMKDKMPDVFYAMRRERDNEESKLRQRNNKQINEQNEDYFSTDSTESDTTEIIEKQKEMELKKETLTKSQKFWKRFVSTWIMIFSFLGIVYIGHTALCILVSVLQALGFREIAALGSKPRIEKQLPGFYLLHWHFFLTSIFFLYGQLLTEHLLIGIFGTDSFILKFIFRHHYFLTFILLIIGLISFVLSLKAGYYKYQFKQLGWCMAIIIIVVVQSTFVMKNIMDGIIWFIIPAIAIITNDVMAYMCGRSFGKRFIKQPLIKLSPNKTWEGAIGACFFTIIFSVIFSSFFIDYQFFICPKYGFSFKYPTCTADPIFIRSIDIYENWKIAPFQLHSVIFALYASVIGPFGGFFASGFKRAFKLKDFSNSVGYGHGGISDRMDCQILMCLFVFVYRKSFIINYT